MSAPPPDDRPDEHPAIGIELLRRMRQPIIVLDASRNISYRNRSAGSLLDRGDLLADQAGALVCCDADSHVVLTQKLREMGLPPGNGVNGADDMRADRRAFKLRRTKSGQPVVVTLLAMHPGHDAGSQGAAGTPGPATQALLTIYEPGHVAEPDHHLLAAAFDLTPAESRLASRIGAGASLRQIADSSGISMNTLKSQLQAVFDKTGTQRQSDLVRLLISTSVF